MNFSYSDKTAQWISRLNRFMDEHVYPSEKEYPAQLAQAADPWRTPPLMERLKNLPGYRACGTCSCRETKRVSGMVLA